MMCPDVVLTKDSGKAVGTILSISGGDAQGVNPKFKAYETMVLDVRMVLATNFQLSLPDQSGALANRLHPLVFTKTFVDRMDLTLADRIIENELPGILHWALEGLARLEANGEFTMPSTSAKTLKAIRHQAGPVNMFVKEWCVVEDGAAVPKADLWRAFQNYCEELDVPNRFIPETFGSTLMKGATGFSNVTTIRALQEGRPVYMYEGIRLTDAMMARLSEDDEDY